MQDLRRQAQQMAQGFMDKGPQQQDQKPLGPGEVPQSIPPVKKPRHIAVSVSAILKGPVLYVPEDLFDPDGCVAELHLGNALIESHLIKYDRERDYKLVTEESCLYDVYTFKLEGVSLKLKGLPPETDKTQDIITDIVAQVDILSCLDHYHPMFTSRKIIFSFNRGVELFLEKGAMEKTYGIIYGLVIDILSKDMKNIKLEVEKKVKSKEVLTKDMIQQKMILSIQAKYIQQIQLMRRRSATQK